jgi:hypothetical protein
MPANDNARRVGAGAIDRHQDPGDGISAFPTVIHVDPLDEIAHHVDGTFVLVVKVTGGKYRRRCFLSAASAEKAHATHWKPATTQPCSWLSSSRCGGRRAVNTDDRRL